MRAAAPPKDQRELLVKFKVIKFLGKGSYGSVYQVQRLSDGQLYALKEMDVRQMSQAEREDSANEVRLLASVVHPNVISYNEAFLDGNRLCIIMEYAPDGDLAKVIKKWQALRRPMPEDLIWRYFIQVVLGLAALHSMRILHRDIKPGNIMVMEGDVAKIGDLGIAKLLKHTLAAKTQIGTPHYMPPEIWKNRPYAFFSDTWALGCILYEMATFNVPFEARSMNELRHKVLKGSYPPLPNTYSPDLIAMVASCLEQVPEKRPSMERILSSPAVMARMHLLPGGTAPRTGPPSTAQSTLIDTIKVPRGNFAAIKSKLPPAQYASDTNQLVGDGPAGLLPRHGAFRPIPEDYSDVMSTPELYEDRRLPVLVPPHKAGGGFGPAGGPGQQPQQKPMPLPFAMGPPAGQRGWPSQAQQAQQVQQAQQLIKAMEAGRLPGLPLALQQVANRLPAAANMFVKPPPAGRASAAPTPSQHPAPPANMWYPSKAAGTPASAVSESHAAYGAFYHPQDPHAAAAGARPRGWEAAKYQQPDVDMRQPGPGYPAGMRLPPVPSGPQQARQPGMQGAGGQAAQPALASRAQQASKQVPPWNYGAGAGARAAALAYAAQLQAAQAQPGFDQGGCRGAAQAAPGLPRYPPSQWAPQPMR